MVEPPPQRITNPTAVFAGLDKITGRIISFDVAINETVQFGALQVTPRVCYSRPPTETPNTDSFVEVDEVTLQGEIKRIFTGWMFAASPGLHAVEHPIYDVWLTDCKGGQNPNVAEAPTEPAPKQPARLPPRRAHRRRARSSRDLRRRRRRCASARAVIPDARLSARSGIQMQARSMVLDFGFACCARAPERPKGCERLLAADRAVERERAEIGLADDRVLQQPVIAPLANFDGAEGLQVIGDVLGVEQPVAAGAQARDQMHQRDL